MYILHPGEGKVATMSKRMSPIWIWFQSIVIPSLPILGQCSVVVFSVLSYSALFPWLIQMFFHLFHSLSGKVSSNPCARYPLVISHSYWKSPFLVGKSTISMAIFNSYVSSPEGNSKWSTVSFLAQQPGFSQSTVDALLETAISGLFPASCLFAVPMFVDEIKMDWMD